MSDEVDRAQEIQELANAEAMHQHRRKTALTPSDECVECGVVIPLARRQAVPCERCVDCQSLHERRR